MGGGGVVRGGGAQARFGSGTRTARRAVRARADPRKHRLHPRKAPRLPVGPMVPTAMARFWLSVMRAPTLAPRGAGAAMMAQRPLPWPVWNVTSLYAIY